MLTLWIIWAVLTLFVISLAFLRKIRARNEDDLLHLNANAAAIPRQYELANTLEKIDHWGKLLTAVDVVFGVVLVAIMLYTTWQQSLLLDK